ncbi:MAG: hypothetical protein ACI4RU_04010 [Acutalibacteraceae bacterium]
MSDEHQKEIMKSAIDKYGPTLQIIVAIEELSELQKSLTKHLRGETYESNISEEIADVDIMLQQLKMIFEIPDHVVNRNKVRKLNRLVERMKEEGCDTRAKVDDTGDINA